MLTKNRLITDFTAADALLMCHTQQQTQPLPNRIHVSDRWMIRRDIPDVLEIARDISTDADESMVDTLLHNRGVVAKVAEYQERVVGFVFYELSKDTIRILNLSVSSHFHRRSVGSQLLVLVEEAAYRRKPRKVICDVDEYNLPLQLFLRSQGYVCTEVVSETGDYRFTKPIT